MTFHQYRPDPPPPPAGQRRERGRYLPTPELATAVNTALAAEQPLLVTGEPGTGKTTLALSVAEQLGLGAPLAFYCRSDHRARDLLYTFDSIRRFYDAQIKDPRTIDATEYRTFNALGTAIQAQRRCVVLIDEIDKAARDFPNDLLNVLDTMWFRIDETREEVPATGPSPVRPIVIVTSNNERQLPEPFLRRCVYHHIEFPPTETLRQIVLERLGSDDRLAALADVAIRRFLDIRRLPLEKRPATAELLVWVKVLLRASNGSLAPTVAALERNDKLGDLAHLGALIKLREDLEKLPRSGARAPELARS